ncbi:MAG TPA: DUF1697 domain-containing protein [Gemmatimonadaceae bacterium]|nr:DUF1697 domain-containing protein [Gemmatimonadaceae bacterium]
MARVVFLRGVNVGGHRTFRPSVLAQKLRHLDVVNIGAAGTFVVRRPVSQAALRAELARLLPFETSVMICSGREVLQLAEMNPLADELAGPETIVPFVSVLGKRRAPSSPLPLRFPASGRWGLRIEGQLGRFVYGVYRREMRAISHLAQVDRVFGVAATTRNWNTMLSIVRVLAPESAGPEAAHTAVE